MATSQTKFAVRLPVYRHTLIFLRLRKAAHALFAGMGRLQIAIALSEAGDLEGAREVLANGERQP
jgi:hypothetical protein